MEMRAAFERSAPARELAAVLKYGFNPPGILLTRQDEPIDWEKENRLGACSLHRSRHGWPGHGRPTLAPWMLQDLSTFEPRGPVCVSEQFWATTDLVTCRTYDYWQTVVPIIHTGTFPRVPVSMRGR